MLSIPHLVVIFLVALVVLGPEKLPEVARVLGKTMADFRRITNDFRMQVEDEMRDLERQTRDRQAAGQILSAATPIAPTPPPVEFSELPSETPPAEKPADGEPHPA